MAVAGPVSLAIAVWLMLSGLAQAESAVRCEAVWIGPSKHCTLRGDWAASGAGPNEAIAKKSAVKRLAKAVHHAAVLDRIRRPLALSDPDRCQADAAAGVRITCFAEPTLWQKRTCFIDLPIEGCTSLPMIELKGVQWRVSEKGRDKMCKSLDKQLKHADKRTRAECMSRCYQDVRVRCPAK